MSILLKLAQMRHSPRAFDGSALTRNDLAEAFEVARLSSSSYNNQPWRFVVGLRGEPGFEAMLQTAVTANQSWMADAGAIIAVLASTVLEKTGETDHAALLGVGMAVGAMELAFTEAGLASMQAGGFDRKECAVRLNLPGHILPVSLLAVGRLPVGHQIPAKQRKSTEAIVFNVGDPIL
ncbi:MAG: nitroreductase family protein [Bacteroidetes bacterium]|nr:nitroreductase family protein [Bacteroidota bacterium]MDA0903547.1 nitroreductase family protein [Bacteroidota bacterium]MDA1242146.1 nitroreductase family protein [Bacteroidota bacterium]